MQSNFKEEKMQQLKQRYDFIVVGGGPAGIFFAYEMLEKAPEKKILIVERGKRIEQRNCPEKENGKCMKCKICDITNGFSGAGGGSDGKLSLYNPEDDDIYVGGNLHKYIGVDKTKRMIDYTDEIYCKFGADPNLEGTEYQAEISELQKKSAGIGLNLINIPIRHLGTDKAHELYYKIELYLEKKGVDIAFNAEVYELMIENESIQGVVCRRKNKSVIEADNVILAPGRVGADWLLRMCEEHNIKTSPGIIDIGVRYEIPNEVIKDINKYMYEAKFIGKPQPSADKVRTFCQNPSGFVTTEVYDDIENGKIVLVNGHSYKKTEKQDNTKVSSNTNLALLASISLQNLKNPMEYSRRIGRIVNDLGEGMPIVQRYGDFKSGKRTWKSRLEKNSVIPTLKTAYPGDLNLGMPRRILTDIEQFIEMIDKIVPGFAADDNLLYGPEIKFYSNKVELSNFLETSIKGLYAIGDGCGLTRGLMMASSSGVYLAQELAKKYGI